MCSPDQVLLLSVWCVVVCLVWCVWCEVARYRADQVHWAKVETVTDTGGN
mgnify:CR=1 FL=1